MSLSQTLATALSGLSAASRNADLVASNIANMQTPGYGVRRILLTAQDIGGGVQVAGVQRQTDPALLSDRRQSQAMSARASTLRSFHQTMENRLGTPGDAGALDTLLAAFQTALITAAANPDSDTHLGNLTLTAQHLALGLNSLSAQVQDLRLQADHAIAADIAMMNRNLHALAQINEQMPRLAIMGHDTSALLDQRQALVDAIAEIMPLREVVRDNGAIALYTTNGATLLEHRPAMLDFTIATSIGAGSGGLSGLRLDGKAVSATMPGTLSGGRLEAYFAIRDSHGPDLQLQLDELARDLASRMGEGASHQGSAGPGVFTDAGQTVQNSNLVGLAGRISLNAALDPAKGGDLWKWRTGLAATDPGMVDDSSRITGLRAALEQTSGALQGSFAERIAKTMSSVAAERLDQDLVAGTNLARLQSLQHLEAAQGVDSDEQIQLLMVIEKTYAANSRVIQAVDDMLDALMRI